jgi:hypothetical protein
MKQKKSQVYAGSVAIASSKAGKEIMLNEEKTKTTSRPGN